MFSTFEQREGGGDELLEKREDGEGGKETELEYCRLF